MAAANDSIVPLLLKNSSDLRDSRTRGPPNNTNWQRNSLSNKSEGNDDDTADKSIISSSPDEIRAHGDNAKSTSRSGKYKRGPFRKTAYDNNIVVPNINCSNLYRQYLWEENKLQHYVERIVNAKPRIDCTLPPISVTETCRVFKMREKGARIKKLTKENQDMVRRLAQTITDRRGIVDCWASIPKQKSARELHMKKNQEKIERKNAHLLERLTAVHPSYQTERQQMLEDYERHVRIRDGLRRFPPLPTRTIYSKGQGSKVPSLEKKIPGRKLVLPKML